MKSYAILNAEQNDKGAFVECASNKVSVYQIGGAVGFERNDNANDGFVIKVGALGAKIKNGQIVNRDDDLIILEGEDAKKFKSNATLLWRIVNKSVTSTIDSASIDQSNGMTRLYYGENINERTEREQKEPQTDYMTSRATTIKQREPQTDYVVSRPSTRKVVLCCRDIRVSFRQNENKEWTFENADSKLSNILVQGDKYQTVVKSSGLKILMDCQGNIEKVSGILFKKTEKFNLNELIGDEENKKVKI